MRNYENSHVKEGMKGRSKNEVWKEEDGKVNLKV